MCMYMYIYTHTESVYMYFSSVEHFLDKMELLSSSSSYFWATWRWGYFYIAQAREMEATTEDGALICGDCGAKGCRDQDMVPAMVG